MEKPRELPPEKAFYPLLGDGKPIQSEEAFNDIANAVMRLRAAFIQHGFKPPKSLEMESHQDGDLMRHILPRDMIAAHPTQSLRDENDTDIMFNILGIEFRYPAKSPPAATPIFTPSHKRL